MDSNQIDTKTAYPTEMAADKQSPEREKMVESLIVYSSVDAALAAKMNLLNKVSTTIRIFVFCR